MVSPPCRCKCIGPEDEYQSVAGSRIPPGSFFSGLVALPVDFSANRLIKVRGGAVRENSDPGLK
jgi:hypothetical protein